jgi:hypothetical protein
LDVSKASEFGDIIYIYARRSDIPSPLTSRFAADVVRRLLNQSFSPGHDFFVVTGGLTFIAAAVAAVVAEYGEIRTLCWDSLETERRYKEVRMGSRHYASH